MLVWFWILDSWVWVLDDECDSAADCGPSSVDFGCCFARGKPAWAFGWRAKAGMLVLDSGFWVLDHERGSSVDCGPSTVDWIASPEGSQSVAGIHTDYYTSHPLTTYLLPLASYHLPLTVTTRLLKSPQSIVSHKSRSYICLYGHF